MSKKYFKKELLKIFKKELNIKVNLNSKMYDFEKWDSMGNFNILLAVEKLFKIKFTSREFNQIKSFKEILKIVEKKK
ncbi:MAG: hypothetical protein CBD34_00325 [Rickettsiales bacterium TMED174]|nr:MAG: hypothetical protein CBD34_00325 [Rickettsiales bacterium TMED174]|tara:strand:- start:1194 stop:1424 length:231 start_codon:yes stop_codon:yes gene_type:complete